MQGPKKFSMHFLSPIAVLINLGFFFKWYF